jgi:hypothetical protein
MADNLHNLTALKPNGSFAAGGSSWLAEVCLVAGRLPFHLTCSNRINILVFSCGFANAFPETRQLSRNYPHPATNSSSDDYALIIHFCTELVEVEAGPYNAVTVVHELAHLAQFGLGAGDTTSTEGVATFMEGAVLGQQERAIAVTIS